MSRPKATKAGYKDVGPLWFAAELNNGLVFQAKNKQACTQLIQRLHAYRILDRSEGYDGYSTLDDYIVKRAGPATISIEKRQLEGIALTPDGAPVDMKKVADQLTLHEQLVAGVEPLPRVGDDFDPDKPLGL